jgi:hypothetical protein
VTVRATTQQQADGVHGDDEQFLVVRVADAVNVAGESVLGSGRESPKVARASVSGSTAARSRSK